jgi:hypothetical protein
VELKVAEVILADAELEHFVDDRKQVMKRTDGLERNGVGKAEDAARGCQHKRVFDGRHRDVTIIKSRCQYTITATDSTGGTRRSAISVENLADVILFGDLHDVISGVSALGIA